MKKILAALTAALMLVLPLSACQGGKEAKTGLAVLVSNDDYAQKEAKDGEEGVTQVNTLAAGALVDKDGKVIKLQLDVVQSNFNYNEEGKVTTPADTVFKTKKDLGEDYNMKGVSGIGKEWYEQAEAFEDYAVGKTAADIRGISVEEGVPTEEDLKSSVTVDIGDWLEVAAQAVENAKSLGASADDTLGLAIHSTAGQTTEDMASQYNYYVANTFDKDNKITSSYLDASIAQYKFEDGKMSDDLHKEVKSKQVLKEDYNMHDASPIGKEWYEQADAFAEWAKGKTAAEGHPTAEDLTSSVTISIGGVQEVYPKSAENAT